MTHYTLTIDNGAYIFSPIMERVLFGSPVTGKLGDVFGGDWFSAVSYAEYYTALGKGAFHTGCDLNRPGYQDSGAPVYAAADGQIVVSRAVPGWQGLMVVIEHQLETGLKVWTRYAHLKETISPGQSKRGELIGYIGDYTPANDPRGDHVHYDVARINLGETPGDWPGASKQAVLDHYFNPVTWHQDRAA